MPSLDQTAETEVVAELRPTQLGAVADVASAHEDELGSSIVRISDRSQLKKGDHVQLSGDVKSAVEFLLFFPKVVRDVPGLDSSAWRWNPVFFKFACDFTHRRTGWQINFDVFKDGANGQLTSDIDVALPASKLVALINADFDCYDTLVPRLFLMPTVKFVVVAPVKDAPWSAALEQHSLFIGELPRCKEVFLPASSYYSVPLGSYHGGRSGSTGFTLKVVPGPLA
jgi:hypothetical protein